MPVVLTDRHWRLAVWAAIAWYCLLCLLIIQGRPGFHYDEAIDVVGSVHMRHAATEIALPHEPGTWLCPGGSCFPIMSARYIGAVKEFFCIPLFALFGPGAGVVRLLAMSLAAFGIFGLATLLRLHVSPAAGAATAWVLALHPSYLDLTVLDNSAFTPWMGAFGALCLALSGYLRRRSTAAAFWAGFAAGFGVWARANYVWMLIAIGVAAVLLLRRRVLLPAPHLAAISLGGILGGLPFLVYQALSRGGTLVAVDLNASTESLSQRLLVRLVLYSRVMLSDGEHRAIWNGPPLPEWQLWLFPLIVLLGAIACLVWARPLLARGFAIALLVLTAIFFATSLRVAEHHMVTAVPLAAAVVVVGCAGLQARSRRAAVALIPIAVVYLGSALYWQASTVLGIRQSGGTGNWSDGIYTLTRRLMTEFPGRQVTVLDWGLQNSLYFLSDGAIRSNEIFWGASEKTDDSNQPWAYVIQRGGVFLLNGPTHRQFPAVSTGFLRSLATTQPQYRRIPIFERNGDTYAEIIEIQPGTAHTESQAPQFEILNAGDLASASRVTGMYEIEQDAWRWTKRAFSITLDTPIQADLRLTLKFHVPESAIERLGSLTLTPRLGSRTLPPERLPHPGDYTLYRDIQASWLQAGPNRFDFALDKWQAAGAADKRELGVIFVSATLEAR